MDNIHRTVLQKQLTYLQENLIALEVAYLLFEATILKHDDVERLEAERINSSRVNALIIHMLPLRGPKAYPELINALEKLGREHVKSFLQEKEREVREKQTKDAQDKQILSWLRSRITNCETGLQLDVLHNFITSTHPFNFQGRSLTAHDTLSYVRALLPRAVPDIEDTESDNCQILNEILYIRLVTAPAATEAVTTNVSSVVHSAGDINCQFSLRSSPSSMDSWSVADVCQWLREQGIREQIVALFQEQNIDGYALKKLSKGDIEDIGVKLVGDRVRIIGKLDDYMKSVVHHSATDKLHQNHSTVDQWENAQTHSEESGVDNNAASNIEILGENSLKTQEDELNFTIPFSSCETGFAATEENCANIVNLKEDELNSILLPSNRLRSFEGLVDSTFKYKKGATVSCTEIESRPGGDLLLPIHRIVMTDLSKREGILLFVRESVAFACACLNERANGTIHFGIQRDKDLGRISYGGVILGTKLSKDFKMYEDLLMKALHKCFYEDQVHCIISCVKPPVFIEVVPRDGDSLFVVEVDVVARHTYCEDLAFYVNVPMEKDTFEGMALYRIVDGAPRHLGKEEIGKFMEDKRKLVKERKDQEQNALQPIHVNVDYNKDLRHKFVRLLCDGQDNFRGDHYMILVINAPEKHMDDSWMHDNLTFLCDIEWKAVFDFDADARICQFVKKQDEVMNIVMCDDFSDRSDPEHLHQLHESIRNSVNPSWIFVNGYSMNPDQKILKLREWKKQKLVDFKDAVRFFKNEIPQGRATIVFLLFSDDMSIFLEAAEEFVSYFPDNWMCVTEDENIGKAWAEEMLSRESVDSSDERIVLGMPWCHVKGIMAEIQSPKVKVICELPTSNGTPIPLKPHIKNDLFDLDILSSSECETQCTSANNEWRDRLMANAEINFYRGESATWWNFYSQDQICKREIHSELHDKVLHTLKKNCYDCLIDKVCIYHQPGAGGTTSGKHVLWSLRKLYRVGVIRNITERQTAEQIIKLYTYEDKNPAPVLLLLDNPEEEKANLMLTELDELTKSFRKHGGDQCLPVCVFLVCWRRTKVPRDYNKDSKGLDSKRVTLKHELSPREKEWFKGKAIVLQRKFECKENRVDSNDAQPIDPRLLISFNIMKESFGKDYIKQIVKEFVSDITDADERRLLKYISLVNAFDLDRRPLPSAAFDSMMVKLPWQGGPRYGKKAISNRWENKLSDAIRILMNETSKPAMGHIHSIRITNPFLSKEILYVLMASSGGKESISDIALEFLNCKDIFGMKSLARDNLLRIVKDVLKQRGRLPDGRPETPFSPLIQFIVDRESIDRAGLVLEKGFQVAEDPFIAQQIARIFIKSQKWEQAVEFAKKATDLKPDSSYLWDTFGRIYEQQLLEECARLLNANREIPIHELIPTIELGLKGLEMFCKVQSTSDEGVASAPNNAGFFGELQMIVCLLECLSHADCFQDINNLRRFILDDKYVPGSLSMLADVNGRKCLEELKMLSQKVDKATNRIEDELLQLRGEIVVDSKRNHNRWCEDSFICLKEKLNMYFGEDNDHPPTGMQESEQCNYRRRRIFRLAGTNLRSIFDLRWASSGEETLQRILQIAIKNIPSKHADAYDYLTIISANLALSSMDSTDLQCNFDNMVEWSKKLYDLRSTLNSSHLEPFLFVIMFNWPRQNTKYSITPKRIENALKQWKDAYFSKYPRQRDENTGKLYRKKETTFFFLRNGSNMESIYTVYERNGRSESLPFGRKPFLKKLQRFKGVLGGNGSDVSVELLDNRGNKSTIKILTSMPIRNRAWWNKEVFFVIGFSWIGPKAFDVTQEDPTLKMDVLEDDQEIDKFPQKGAYYGVYNRRKINELQKQELQSNQKLFDLAQELVEIDKIKEIQKTRKLSDTEKQKLSRERQIYEERNTLTLTIKELMASRIPEFT